MPKSLSEFAAVAADKRRKCKVCGLPKRVRDQVDAVHGTVPITVTERWLRTVGHLVSDSSIRTHYLRGHNHVA